MLAELRMTRTARRNRKRLVISVHPPVAPAPPRRTSALVTGTSLHHGPVTRRLRADHSDRRDSRAYRRGMTTRRSPRILFVSFLQSTPREPRLAGLKVT